MPRIDFDAYDQHFVTELVASRLALAPGEYTLLSGAPGLRAPLESLEDYTQRVIAEAREYGARVKAELEEKVTALIGAGGAVGWNARRTLRRLGRGTQAQRCSPEGESERERTAQRLGSLSSASASSKLVQ